MLELDPGLKARSPGATSLPCILAGNYLLPFPSLGAVGPSCLSFPGQVMSAPQSAFGIRSGRDTYAQCDHGQVSCLCLCPPGSSPRACSCQELFWNKLEVQALGSRDACMSTQGVPPNCCCAWCSHPSSICTFGGARANATSQDTRSAAHHGAAADLGMEEGNRSSSSKRRKCLAPPIASSTRQRTSVKAAGFFWLCGLVFVGALLP